MTNLLTDSLPPIRCTSAMKRRLTELAARSVNPRVSDHMRFAIERYLDQEEAALAQAPNQTVTAQAN